ncbi:MAG: hypothetical protein JW934_01060 [Anaerolineae bacterium]|nr:hypothetical protein [Anaerolineae bacterium]
MSLDDRLSFGGGPLGGLPPEAEQPQEAPQAPKKRNLGAVFLIAAMAGLVLLGILALVAAFVWVVPAQRQRAAMQATQTIDAATAIALAWTATPEPTSTTQIPTWTPTLPSTETPVPTATATRVVPVDSAQSTPVPTATRLTSADWGAATPQAGLGGLGIAAIAVGLGGLVVAARRMRKS